MIRQRNQMEFEQESHILETNMACITNELSDLILGKAGIDNQIISGNPLIVPIHEYTFISSIDQLRYRLNPGSFIQSKTGIKEGRPIVARPRSQSVDINIQQLPISTHSCYKRRASAADVERHESLLCAAIEKFSSSDSHVNCLQTKRGSGVRRKYPRVEPKEEIDYDSVVIDLKAIGLSTSNRQPNDVLRLFGLFRKLHHYLNDKIPFAADSEVKHQTKPAPFMPRTMNVQTQIKHAIHKCNLFCFRLFEKLDEHKLADRDNYFECYRSVSLLRKMIKQFEPFKEAELEHRNGVFVNSFGSAQAKNLEILLSQITGKIRECNIFVEVYLLKAKNNAETVSSPSMETLKKAVAIAGAMYNNNNNNEIVALEKKDNFEPCKIAQNVEHCVIGKSTQNDSRGGGINGMAVVPAPDINSRGSRFLGV